MSLIGDINRKPVESLPVRLQDLSTEAIIQLQDAITDELTRRYEEGIHIE